MRSPCAGDIIYATAWDGDEPRGCAVLDFRTDSDPELKHLLVYPAYRDHIHLPQEAHPELNAARRFGVAIGAMCESLEC